ncbi:MAG TPA: monovalent cation/H(+) antiporter subunit G [Longimicrobiales bacterium]|nr:monovalent cation/H(+) antiporter subunit G [Longimicrobiales bacterium]
MIFTHVVVGVLLAVGVFFLMVGAIGFARLPDVFCRMHVTGVIDTLGAPLIMLATAVYLGLNLVSLKLVLALLFLTITSPLVGHMLARAALEAGHEPGVIEDSAEFMTAGAPKRKQQLRRK